MKLPWKNNTQQKDKPVHLKKGEMAESIAERFLAKKGFILVEKNFSSKMGEIDLIMTEGKQLVFIEVRLRTHQRVSAIETIGFQKQAKIIKTAQFFLLKNKSFSNYPCRFDVVGLDSLDINRVNWISDAFQT